MSFPMDAPDDMSGLSAALAAGQLDAGSILSVWMKTEGNGLRNDHTTRAVRSCRSVSSWQKRPERQSMRCAIGC